MAAATKTAYGTLAKFAREHNIRRVGFQPLEQCSMNEADVRRLANGCSELMGPPWSQRSLDLPKGPSMGTLRGTTILLDNSLKDWEWTWPTSEDLASKTEAPTSATPAQAPSS